MDYIDLIQKTIDYIDNNITKKITVQELANISGFSTYHYYRLFNNYVGMPVMEYVSRRKLQYSCFNLDIPAFWDKCNIEGKESKS